VKLTHIRLQRVHYMPKELEPGVLYVSKEFNSVLHLCACGCGSKVSTPLGPTEWSLKDTPRGPSLWPSVGNWQLPCQSHYVINAGQIQWARKWSTEQIAAGRKHEDERRQEYYNAIHRKRSSAWSRFWRRWLGFFTTDK
jgi:hypothetical protein